MTEYVVGFAFDHTLSRVALIHKTHGPTAVVGKWNGIGGKVETQALETDATAMCREFFEEAGVLLSTANWTRFCVLLGDTWAVSFFRAVLDPDLFNKISTQTEEGVATFQATTLPDNIVPNLRWLLPMALDYNIRTARVFEYGTSHLLFI